MIKENELNHFSTYLLAKEAENRGITVSKVFPKKKLSYLKLKLGNKIETIIGQRISSLSFNAHFICKNKEMTRIFLQDKEIKTTEGKMFYKEEKKEALNYINTVGFPLVIKPLDGTWGTNVFLGIKSNKDALTAIDKILENKNRFLIEKEFQGNEYRILATKDKLLGIINRIPANVIGDGENSIEKLIKIKNQDPRRGDSHEKSLVKIKIDDEIKKGLKEKGLDLSYIPKKDEQVFLRKNSNLSTGGDSIDITDNVHPKVKELAPKVISAVPDLPYAGFDFLTPDITKDPEDVGYAIIEINDSPMLSMHHIPYQGKQREVAKDIIDIAFPETKKI